jgi:hypothetical protein
LSYTGTGIVLKEFVVLVPCCGSGMWIPKFFMPDTDPGSWILDPGVKKHRIPDPAVNKKRDEK